MTVTPYPPSPYSPPPVDYEKRMRIAAYLSYVGLMGVSVVLVIPIVLLAVLQGKAPEDVNIVLALLATVIAELMVIGAALTWTKQLKTARQVLALHNFRWKTLLAGVALGAISIMLLQAIGFLAELAGFDFANSDTTDQLGSLTGVARYAVLFLCVPFLVPIVEEIFFRGYVMGFLLKGRGAENEHLRSRAVISAILWSGLLFGLAHFQGLSSASDVLIVAWTATFGVLNGLLRFKTKSLYPAIASHATYNLITTVLVVASL